MQRAFEKSKEKIKVTSLETIVTGTKDKPYFEIKYKEVGKEYYRIGYSSYDLNNVLGWKEECFEIVNQVAEEYKQEFRDKSPCKPDHPPCDQVASEYGGGWIPCSERLPEIEADVLLSLRSLDVYTGFRANTEGSFYVEGEGYVEFENVIAWQPLPQPYKENENE